MPHAKLQKRGVPSADLPLERATRLRGLALFRLLAPPRSLIRMADAQTYMEAHDDLKDALDRILDLFTPTPDRISAWQTGRLALSHQQNAVLAPFRQALAMSAQLVTRADLRFSPEQIVQVANWFRQKDQLLRHTLVNGLALSFDVIMLGLVSYTRKMLAIPPGRSPVQTPSDSNLSGNRHRELGQAATHPGHFMSHTANELIKRYLRRLARRSRVSPIRTQYIEGSAAPPLHSPSTATIAARGGAHTSRAG